MLSTIVRLLLLNILLFLFPWWELSAQIPPGSAGAPSSSYDSIVEKDLFRPGRKKWVPQPIPPLRPLRPPGAAAPTQAPRPEPEPKFILHGVALVGDGTKVVVLEEAQLTKGKILSFRIGERLGPYQVKEIHPKGTVLEGPAKTINLMLRGEVSP